MHFSRELALRLPLANHQALTPALVLSVIAASLRRHPKRITATLANAGANIEEVHHQRAFTLLAAQNVEIECVLQTRNQAHVEQVLASLRAQGMEAQRV